MVTVSKGSVNQASPSPRRARSTVYTAGADEEHAGPLRSVHRRLLNARPRPPPASSVRECGLDRLGGGRLGRDGGARGLPDRPAFTTDPEALGYTAGSYIALGPAAKFVVRSTAPEPRRVREVRMSAR
jgi:hypothetical protein